MNELGGQILNAMRDQGWTVAFTPKEVITVTPANVRRATPAELFEDGAGHKLQPVTLLWALDGLQWPWPPDHREDVYGEVPRAGW